MTHRLFIFFTFALSETTTDCPNLFSNLSFATFAVFPPSFAISLLASKFFGSSFSEISFVVAYANIFKISSIFVILSLKFSFLSPLKFLYSLTLFPDHAFVISFVNIAKSSCFEIPTLFHSSVNCFLTSIVFNR